MKCINLNGLKRSAAVSLLLISALSCVSPMVRRTIATVYVPTCKELNGTPKGERCYCGQKEIGVRYETCEENVPKPQNITRLAEQPLVGEKIVTKDGWIYRAIENYVIGTFDNDYSICSLELGQKRENDDRYFPGGSGESGGRIGCFAMKGQCPSLKECLMDSQTQSPDFRYLWYQVVYAKDHYDYFENRGQLKPRR